MKSNICFWRFVSMDLWLIDFRFTFDYTFSIDDLKNVVNTYKTNQKNMTKFNRTQKFTKKNIANIPQNKAIIYKIKIKIGTKKNLQERRL